MMSGLTSVGVVGQEGINESSKKECAGWYHARHRISTGQGIGYLLVEGRSTDVSAHSLFIGGSQVNRMRRRSDAPAQ